MRRFSLMIAAAAALALPPLVATHAASSAGTTVSPQHPALHWQGSTFVVGAGIGALELKEIAGLPLDPACPPQQADPARQVCDYYTFTADVPASYWHAHPGGVTVSIAWPDPGNHFDVGVYDAAGTLVGYNLTGDPITVFVPNAHGTYQVRVDPELDPHGSSYTGSVTITAAPPKTAAGTAGPAVYRAVPVHGSSPSLAPHTTALPGRHTRLRAVGHVVAPGVRAFEPTIGVDPHGTVYINGRDNTSGPPYDEGVDREQVRVSKDGGRTWQLSLPTVAGRPTHPISGDPYLWVDPDLGRVYFFNLQYLGESRISWSDDAGATWHDGAARDAGVEDHPTLVATRVPAGSSVRTTDPAYPKILYWCTNSVVATHCDRSLDGGLLFQQGPGLFPDQTSNGCAGTTGHLAADRFGRAFVGAANCGIPEIEVTEDGGQTWQEHVISKTMFSDGHEVDSAADRAGTMYAAWIDIRHDLPYLSVSHDHGRTWGTPLLVAPPGVKHVEYFNITAGDAGRVALSLVGTTSDDASAADAPWRYYLTVTQNATARRPVFESNVATMLSTGSDLLARGSCCPGAKDFLDLQQATHDQGRLWGSAALSCAGACVRTVGGSSTALGADVAVEEVSGPALRGRLRQLR